jgi:multidrug resistance protein, MATE family
LTCQTGNWTAPCDALPTTTKMSFFTGESHARVGEYRTIVRHAGTVLAGQLAVMAFGITDTVVAGRYSPQALAALSVGSAVYISVFVALTGVLQALLPIWAELQGARQFVALGRSARQSLYLCLMASAVGVGLLTHPGLILQWTQVPLSMEHDVRSYLDILALALVPSLMFRLFSTLNQSLGKPFLVTAVQAAALLLKIPLSIWFTFGGGPVPAMGAPGCALATLLVNLVMLGLALTLLWTQELYRPYRLWHVMEAPDWTRLLEFARLGIPGGLAVAVEVTSFTLMALFIARLGSAASAAHQVAANLAAVLYMVPLSLGIATSSRVSYWLGAGKAAQAHRAIRAGLTLALLAALGLAAALLAGRQGIAMAYSSDEAVNAQAATLLAWVAFYHVADALQALCVFVLRCYRIVLAPLLIYGLLLWGVGLTGGYGLAYTDLPGLQATRSPLAFWQSSVAALCLAATVLVLLLWHTLRQVTPKIRIPGESDPAEKKS